MFNGQYIILKDGILRFNSFNITSKRGVYFTVHSLGSIRTKGNRTIADLRYGGKAIISPSTQSFAPIKG